MESSIDKNIFKIMRKGDFILIAFLLLLSLSFYFFPNKEINSIEIVYKETHFGTFSLDKNIVIEISEEIKVEIKNHKFRMLENNCPNQTCCKQGWEKDSPIICVPNKIMIKPNIDEILITY